MKTHTKTCPLCKKEFHSNHKNMVEFEMAMHYAACKKQHQKEELSSHNQIDERRLNN